MKFPHAVPLQQLAALTATRILGDGSRMVSGINEIHCVEEGDITFVDHPKYYEKALGSRASFVIINKEVAPPDGKSLLFAEDPFSVYIRIVREFRSFHPQRPLVHPSAVIGEGTVLQPNVFVGENVTIGRHCLIHANVSIYDHTVIGDDVVIHSGAVIGADAFYFKRRPDRYEKMLSCGRVVIHDRVEIGANCTLDKGVSADTVIGEGTKMDNSVHVGHDTVIGKNCLFAAQVGIAGVVTIEDEVILWGQVGVQKDLVIGRGAVVLGTSGVSKSLEAGKTYFGAPAIEARQKWRELASLRQLPVTLEELEKKIKSS
jgi:UDP-3-O-[3-hydroxymyristoyl] glucosamine N-acyltransferase